MKKIILFGALFFSGIISPLSWDYKSIINSAKQNSTWVALSFAAAVGVGYKFVSRYFAQPVRVKIEKLTAEPAAKSLYSKHVQGNEIIFTVFKDGQGQRYTFPKNIHPEDQALYEQLNKEYEEAVKSVVVQTQQAVNTGATHTQNPRNRSRQQANTPAVEAKRAEAREVFFKNFNQGNPNQ